MISLILTLSSCSISKKEEVAVKSDDLEFAVDSITDAPVNTEFKVEEQKISKTSMPDDSLAPPVVEVEDAQMTAPMEPKFGDFKKTEEKNHMDSPVEIKISETSSMPNAYGPLESYRMQKGDTLMMVSYKIYGDYRKWRDLKAMNKNIKKFKEGVELKYQMPDSKFNWKPNGLPYLVKTGDTLQVISMEKFATTRKWKSIYNNNRPLIRDPNLIFAGFTIYYQPSRELASQKK